MRTFFGYCMIFVCISTMGFVYAIPPSFHERVSEDLLNADEEADGKGRVERLYKRDVSYSNTFQQNIRNLFFPSGGGGQIWNILRIVGYAAVVMGLVYLGVQYIKDADDESKVRDTTLNLLYLFGGSTLFFASIWILQVGLSITNISGSASIVEAVEQNLFLQLLLFLKAAAFFFAIIMFIWNGYQIMSTIQKEDKLEKGKNGILNVVLALAFIKGIDYVYFIAQAPDFKTKATEFIVEIAKIMAYLLGFAFVGFMLYAGFRLVTDGGKGEGFGEFKKITWGVFLGSIVIFLFLLIMYQVVQEFTGPDSLVVG